MSDSFFETLKKIPPQERNAYLASHVLWKSRRERLPQHMFAELTPRCTLSCKMCYVHYADENKMDIAKELTTLEWCQLIKEADEIGVSSITLTGGEAMIRQDYQAIYQCAYEKGMRISIITNGTLIDRDMIDFLLEHPPETIYLTMYGFSEETYQRNCGNGAAFRHVLDAIALIEEANIRLEIQTTVTQDMVGDFANIYHFAKEHGHVFRFDHALRSSDCCSKEKIEELTVPDDVMDSLVEELYGVKINYGEMNDECLPKNINMIEKGMMCGAGNNVFQINWQGYMQLCAGLSAYQLSPLQEGMKACWEKLKAYAAEVPQNVECQTCKYRARCKHCVALHYADTHEFGKPSPRLCYKIQHGLE